MAGRRIDDVDRHLGRLVVGKNGYQASRLKIGTRGSLEEILTGPATEGDGRRNLLGALRRSMAMCGYRSLKELQKAEVVVSTGHGR